MALCNKCQQSEATVHFTREINGREETFHLCQACAPSMGIHSLNPKELEALSVLGKKCGFCGREAFSGVTSERGTIYWCYDCGVEYNCIFAELCNLERPDLFRQDAQRSSFLSTSFDSELQEWSDITSQKVARILKERRWADGRDKGS